MGENDRPKIWNFIVQFDSVIEVQKTQHILIDNENIRSEIDFHIIEELNSMRMNRLKIP